MNQQNPNTTVPSSPPPRRRWTFWRFIVTLFLYLWAGLFLIVGGMAILGFVIYDHITQPGVPGPEIPVEIPGGSTGQRVAEILEEHGVVYHRSFFVWAMRLDESKEPIIQGGYEIPRGLSPMEVLEILQQGPEFRTADQIKVTIPEGLTIEQMAEQFDAPEAFIAAASDPQLIDRLKIEAESLEGFLMPETYFFDKRPTEREVVERMVEHFEEVFAELAEELPEARSRNLIEVVTLASLVEEEARVEEERPMVAAVLYNRIEEKMPLQMDSTLQYALKKYGQRMLEADKQVDSPYNTYRYRGLPPGPISSPGKSSIRAALQPADVDYLYFVSNADGRTHTFSTTFAEHERAVAKYRREIAEQRRELQQAPGTN